MTGRRYKTFLYTLLSYRLSSSAGLTFSKPPSSRKVRLGSTILLRLNSFLLEQPYISLSLRIACRPRFLWEHLGDILQHWPLDSGLAFCNCATGQANFGYAMQKKRILNIY